MAKNTLLSGGFGLNSDAFNIYKSEKSGGSGRDPRRSFTPGQKGEIWDNQDGRCAGAHCKHSRLLRQATHYDHIKPWEDGGRTTVSNGQALCATCHQLKTARENSRKLKKADRKRKKKSTSPSISGFAVPEFKTPQFKAPKFKSPWD